jgi:hypothetical protein
MSEMAHIMLAKVAKKLKFEQYYFLPIKETFGGLAPLKNVSSNRRWRRLADNHMTISKQSLLDTSEKVLYCAAYPVFKNLHLFHFIDTFAQQYCLFNAPLQYR